MFVNTLHTKGSLQLTFNPDILWILHLYWYRHMDCLHKHKITATFLLEFLFMMYNSVMLLLTCYVYYLNTNYHSKYVRYIHSYPLFLNIGVYIYIYIYIYTIPNHEWMFLAPLIISNIVFSAVTIISRDEFYLHSETNGWHNPINRF